MSGNRKDDITRRTKGPLTVELVRRILSISGFQCVSDMPFQIQLNDNIRLEGARSLLELALYDIDGYIRLCAWFHYQSITSDNTPYDSRHTYHTSWDVASVDIHKHTPPWVVKEMLTGMRAKWEETLAAFAEEYDRLVAELPGMFPRLDYTASFHRYAWNSDPRKFETCVQVFEAGTTMQYVIRSGRHGVDQKVKLLVPVEDEEAFDKFKRMYIMCRRLDAL